MNEAAGKNGVRSAALRRGTGSQRGSTMVMVAVAITMVGMLSLSMMMMSNASARAAREKRREVASLFVAEAALTEAVQEFVAGDPAAMGSEKDPVAFGGADFWVDEVDMGGGLTSLVATGQDGLAETRVELVLYEGLDPFYEWAAFGSDSLSLDSDALIDSYNSLLGSYEDQEVNGSGNDTYASTNGDVGSNGSITVDQNSIVYGDAVAGPGETTTILGSAQVMGTTLPSKFTEEMPPLDIPSGTSLGNLSITGGGSVSLSSGSHFFDALSVNGSLMVEGPATLVFDSINLRSNSEIIVDAEDGPVEIYVLNDFVMNSNTTIGSTTKTPADLKLLLDSDNVINPDVPVDLDEVDFDSNAKFYGTIYAPRAAIEINSNFELYGSLLAREVSLDSFCKIHFDEALLTQLEDATEIMHSVCWRVVPHGYQPPSAAAKQQL